MYILGFNGPPRSGKDTMAHMFLEHMDSQGCTIPVIETTPTEQLYAMACVMTGWQHDRSTYEEFKTTHFDLFGKDGRQIMIDVSERFLKPVYGEQTKAKMTLAALKDFPGLVLFTSLGFQQEADAFADVVGRDNLYVVRVHRPGANFENDSREWVRHMRGCDYENVAGLEQLRGQAELLYDRLVENMGWKL